MFILTSLKSGLKSSCYSHGISQVLPVCVHSRCLCSLEGSRKVSVLYNVLSP